MPKKHILLLFFTICQTLMSVCGQDVTFHNTLETHNWQDQILQQVDIDELGEAAYGQLLEELSELIVWSDTASSSLLRGHLSQHLTWRSNRCLNTRDGYIDQSETRQQNNKAFLGDPWQHSVRHRMQFGQHWQAGFTLEKDAGEPWRNSVPGFDSWHGFVRMRKANLSENFRISDAILGHYRLRMGCGLLINQGFSLGKQYIISQLLNQRTNTITPHASLTESGFMQGVAADMRIGQHTSVLPYFSARQIDGTLNEKQILTALQTDGYHRTISESGHRSAAWQIVSGMRIGWRSEWFDLGLHGTYTQLQYNYIRQKNYYNTNYFRGHQLAQFSFDYNIRALGGALRGECAVDDAGAWATINVLQYDLGDYWRTSILHRYFGPKYRQLHASSVSESSGMQGEQGILLTAEGQLSRNWQLNCMLDGFSFCQTQYGIRDSTSRGTEASIRLLYDAQLRSKLHPTASLAYRIKVKGDYIRHSLDGTCVLNPLECLSLHTQFRARVYSNVDENPSYGYALSQSIGWNNTMWHNFQFSVEGQACYFRTEDYDSRVYLTERTILYGFGLPMLYGEGLRYSVTSTLKIGPRINVDLKWAMTNYANRNAIGSGLQKINSNTQQDLWLQLRLVL